MADMVSMKDTLRLAVLFGFLAAATRSAAAPAWARCANASMGAAKAAKRNPAPP